MPTTERTRLEDLGDLLTLGEYGCVARRSRVAVLKDVHTGAIPVVWVGERSPRVPRQFVEGQIKKALEDRSVVAETEEQR